MPITITNDSHPHQHVIYTGVLLAPPTTKNVDLREFRKSASGFGFFLGLLSMAADMGVYAAMGRVEGGISLRLALVAMATWSVLISIATWMIYCLVQRMIALVSFEDKEVLRAMERCCLLWSIIGLTGGYCIVDFFLLPTSRFLISVGMSAITIGTYQLLILCIDRWERWENRMAKKAPVDDMGLRIV